MKATVCRGAEGAPCVAVPALQNVGLAMDAEASAASRVVIWHDALPTTVATGEPKLLVYRVELSNLEGKTAGWSDPAYAAAGTPPVAEWIARGRDAGGDSAAVAGCGGWSAG